MGATEQGRGEEGVGGMIGKQGRKKRRRKEKGLDWIVEGGGLNAEEESPIYTVACPHTHHSKRS